MAKRKHTEQQEEDEPSAIPSTPTRPKRTAKSPRKKTADDSWDPYGGATTAGLEADDPSSPLTDLDVEFSPMKGKKGGVKRSRKKKSDEPVVYTEKEIPPVEKKVTQFRGRLGYACLNTVLRAIKPEPIFCSRTCRKDTIHKNGLDFAKDLGLKNTKDLIKLIEWNEENSIRFLRISSEMFPFASHAELGYDLSYAAAELKAVGDLAKKLGHRLTTHPGQFTQLASPKEAVVEASIRELEYHCQMMRYMGLGKDSVIILHMGGVYNDKPATIARFRENYTTKLTQEMRDRLVLENDEMCYSVDDLLPVCEELGIPIVLDYHHNWINPSTTPLPLLIPRLNAIWHAKHIHPKQHLSSPKPAFADGSGTIMDRRAHADRCYQLPEEMGMEGVSRDVDLMIEAKDKEQAVLMLYRIYGLESVKWESLRPEKKQSVEVKEEIGAEEEEDVGEGDVEGGEETTAKKRRRTRSVKKDSQVGVEVDVDTEESPKRTRKTRSKKDDTTTPTEPTSTSATTSPRTRTPRKRKSHSISKLPTDEDVTSLINQEDAPVPVDGADVKEVEAQEHPEAVGAAVVDGDGCGVRSRPSRRRGRGD